MRTHLGMLAWALGLSFGAQAFAADLPLDVVEAQVDDLWVRSRGLRQQVDPAAVTRGTEVDDRYRQAVRDRLLSRWEDAALQFWILDRAGAFEGEARRAEVQWYLAECLDQAGHGGLAEDAYRVMTEDPAHPFRQEAVTPLLALYLREGKGSEFDALYQREVVAGGLRLDDRTRYLVGRLLLKQGDLFGARSYFEQVPSESPEGPKALYHLAVLASEGGDAASLQQAMALFTSLLDRDAVPSEIRDLAWLGVARIHQARREWIQALEAYQKVSEASPHRVDQLYEMVWVFTRVEQWGLAKHAVELFTLSFPEHPLVDEMKLVRAHLAYRGGLEDAAFDAYGEVVETLEPVSERFGELMASPAETAQALSALAAGGEDPSVSLPKDGARLVERDSEFQRAVRLYAELQTEDREIGLAEDFIGRISDALGAGEGGSSDDVLAIRRGVLKALIQGLQARQAVLEAEEAWLQARSEGPPERERAALSRLSVLSGRVEDLSRAWAGVEQAEGERLRALEAQASEVADVDGRQRVIAGSLRQWRAESGIDLRFDPRSARLEGLHRRLSDAMDVLVALAPEAPTLTRSAVADLLEDFRGLAQEVEGHRQTWLAMSSDVRAAGAQVGQRAFSRARSLVDETIMGAEMGLVNIHWTRWVEAGEESRRLKMERNALLQALGERYDLLQKRLGR